MKQNLAPRLTELFVQNQLQSLGVERSNGAAILLRVGHMARGLPPENQLLNQLLHDPSDDLLVSGMERHHRADSATGEGPAQIAVPLHHQYRSSLPGRSQGRAAPGYASADHDHVELFHSAVLHSFPCVSSRALKIPAAHLHFTQFLRLNYIFCCKE